MLSRAFCKDILFWPRLPSQVYLISERSGEPYWTQFWDGVGVYLDFTQPKTIALVEDEDKGNSS